MLAKRLATMMMTAPGAMTAVVTIETRGVAFCARWRARWKA